MRHVPSVAVLLSVVPLLAGACAQSGASFDGGGSLADTGGGSVVGRACQAHVDCGGEAACLDGVCSRECEQDAQCPDPSYMCWGFRCLKRDGGGPDTVEPPGDECAVGTDCDQTAAPQGCRNGRCVPPECYSDGQCLDPARPHCVFYVCGDRAAPPDTVEPRDVAGGQDSGPAACTTWQDCPDPPQGCRGGQCVPAECTQDDDCPAQERCVLFLCAAVQPPPDVVESPDVPAAEDVPGAPDVPTPPDVPLGGYGETCTRGGDCETGLCLNNKMTGGSTCTQACASTLDCPQPDWCGEVTSTFVCIANDSGTACAGGCLSGRSFLTGADCFCTTPCPSALWCPPDFACVTDVSDARLCRPIGGACTPSVSGDPACRGQLCYPVDLQATTGICTTPCEGPTDCPPGWFCYAELVDGQTVQTCQRLD